MKKTIYVLMTLIMALALVAGCGGPDKNAEKTIILSDAGWDSVKFHNAVVSYIADKAYGLKTKIVSGSTPITHTALVRGDIDVNLETWSDNIASYKNDVAGGYIVELGVNFDDNRQGLYVPRYVIEGDAARGIAPMAPDLKTVADLKKYSKLFVDEENPAKGRIYGAIPGWAVDEILFKKFNYYGLNEQYNYFRPGSDAALNASIMAAYAKGEPIVAYNWEPTWLSGKLDLVLLEDVIYNEKGFLEGETAFPAVRVTVTANKNLPKKAPEFTDFLKKYHTSSALTAEALAYIAESKASYDEAAAHFLKEHSELLDKWLPADKAKSVRSALGN
ncbi:MAG: ABC transporter substrate-binding protein [Acidaminococcaceae bacterium]